MSSNKKTYRILFAACLLAAGCLQGAASPLQLRIESLLRSHRCKVQRVGVVVLTGSGRVVAQVNPSEPLKPASNLKILTTAAALHFLGPDYAYETRLIGSGPIQGGILRGDLIIWGTGDPNISGRFYDGDPLAVFRLWLERLQKAGLKEIEGDLVADDTYFDDAWFNPAWDRTEEGRWYSAQVSSLNLNDNCIDVTVEPTRPGKPARVSFVPPSSFIRLKGAPLTVKRGKVRIGLYRLTGTNRITVRGTIPLAVKRWKDYVAIHNPPLFLATTLADFLKREGIPIRGTVRRVDRKNRKTTGGPATEPPRGLLLVRHLSPLRRDLPVINARSQNLHAEVLLKALGAAVAGEGSVKAGAACIRRFLSEFKIRQEGLVIADGSGLSHANRTSALTIAGTLKVLLSKPYFPLWLNSLARPGRDGTLRRRFRRYPHLKEKVFGKTGYISGVSTFSGYVRRGERTWIFSILLNSFPRGLQDSRALQEEIVEAIWKEMGRKAAPKRSKDSASAESSRTRPRLCFLVD